jgi:hypothetical protein
MSELTSKELVKQADERDREFSAIADMVDAATKHGLMVEAIWSFGQARKGGDSIEDAVQFALLEWVL